VVECGIVFRSVGYRGIPLPGVPFDEGSCTVPNDGGRVRGPDGAVVTGAYCAGWIKRGPTGVIGTNKKDATETVALLLEDARGERLGTGEPAEAMDALLEERGVAVVTQTGWQAIDAAERAAGEPQGRPRVKLAEWDALLGAAGHEPAAR
jgi:ferredoxin--NADP+ reductase